MIHSAGRCHSVMSCSAFLRALILTMLTKYYMAPRAWEAPVLYRVPLAGEWETFRGIIPTPCLLRRFRRSRVYGGFVFCFGFCARGDFASSVLFRLRRWVFFAVVSFCQINHLFRNVRNIANSASPVCRVWEALRVY